MRKGKERREREGEKRGGKEEEGRGGKKKEGGEKHQEAHTAFLAGSFPSISSFLPSGLEASLFPSGQLLSLLS